MAFEPLDGTPRAMCPLDDERLIESAAAGMLPLTIDGELYLVVAPRGAAARRILRLIEENPARARRFRFTSAERLNRFVLRCGGEALAARAADELKQQMAHAVGRAAALAHAKSFRSSIVLLLALAAAVWRRQVPCSPSKLIARRRVPRLARPAAGRRLGQMAGRRSRRRLCPTRRCRSTP